MSTEYWQLKTLATIKPGHKLSVTPTTGELEVDEAPTALGRWVRADGRAVTIAALNALCIRVMNHVCSGAWEPAPDADYVCCVTEPSPALDWASVLLDAHRGVMTLADTYIALRDATSASQIRAAAAALVTIMKVMPRRTTSISTQTNKWDVLPAVPAVVTWTTES